MAEPIRSHDKDWDLIVPESLPKEADRLFQDWTEEQRRLGRSVDQEKIRRDQVFAGKGCVVRYLLRRDQH